MHAAASWIYKSNRKGLSFARETQNPFSRHDLHIHTNGYKRDLSAALTHSYIYSHLSRTVLFPAPLCVLYFAPCASLIFLWPPACLARTRCRWINICRSLIIIATRDESLRSFSLARLTSASTYSKIQIPTQEHFQEWDERPLCVCGVKNFGHARTARGCGFCWEGLLLFSVQLTVL